MQGNYKHTNTRPAIKDIDYTYLASIAETGRTSFEVLCARAERGEPIHPIEKDPEWVSYHEAADILNTTYATLAGVFTSPRCQLPYHGIHWKTKSKNNPKEGKRGCGVLFYKPDLVVIANIRKHTRFQLLTALRVFEAMERGLI